MSYYSKITLSISGVVTTPDVDSKAAKAIKDSAKSGNTISAQELKSTILPQLDDYRGFVGAGERPLVRALEAVHDRKNVSIDGQPLRMTETAKRSFQVWLAQISGADPIGNLPQAAFEAAVSTALRGWYAAELERRITDLDTFDPETAANYTPSQRAEDRARAQDPNAFQPFSNQGQAFSFRPDENLAWLHLGDDADHDFPLDNAAGEKVPRDAIAFLELNYDPIYAGQQLTSWFAFDKRNGEMLRFFETQA